MKALLGLAMAAASALAQDVDVVYVTDLSIFTMLAGCAQDALSYNIMDMTQELCPTAVDGLQSCVCSQSDNLSSIASGISSSVSNYCGATASADQASASSVLSAYCNQDADVAFPTPSPAVTQYITDIPELGFLAMCASSQVAGIVQGLTDSLCPTDAPDLATCACQKNQNSLMVAESINTWVAIDCESNKADITSAQAFFSAYCNLNAGTSAFPSASYPPGDMSYYVTDMPQFSSLAECARSAVESAIHSTATYYCPTGGPQLLASCACIKPQMSSEVSVFITDAIQRECSEADATDLSSGLSVFAQYCSAARGEVVEAGITTSVAQTLPFGLPAASSGAGSGSSLPTATAASTRTTLATTPVASGSSSGSAGSSGGSSGNSSDNSGDSSADNSGSSGSKKSGASTGTIVGAAVGSVVGVAMVVAAGFFAWRHARQSNARANADQFQNLDNLAPAVYGGAGGDGYSKAELGGTPLSSMSHVVVSPISPSTDAGTLAAVYSQNSNSIHAQSVQASALSGSSQVQGPPQELYGSGQTAEMPGSMSFQSGPVPEVYSELDGSLPAPTSSQLRTDASVSSTGRR